MDLESLYKNHYKKLIIVPIVLFLLSATVIFLHQQKTGTLVNLDIDFEGGTIATLSWDKEINIEDVESRISQKIGNSVDVRTLRDISSKLTAITFQTDKDTDAKGLKSAIAEVMNAEVTDENYSVRIVGPAMGSAFLATAEKVMLFGFILTAIVLWFTFKIPEIAVGAVVSGSLNIVAAVAAMVVLGMKLNSATLAALLMFLASSIDDNILIISRILERKKHAAKNAVVATRTGAMMILASFIAFLVLRFATNVQIFQDFATVLIAGMLADTMNTWFLNTSLVLWYVERKFGKSAL